MVRDRRPERGSPFGGDTLYAQGLGGGAGRRSSGAGGARLSLLFINHSSQDKEQALELHRRLLARGYDASQLFLDSDADSGIQAGADWEAVLYARLKSCQALLVLCSKRWRQSKWCFAEVVRASSDGKHIFPIVIDEGELEPILAKHQVIDLHGQGDAAYERLFAALESIHLGPHDSFPWDAQRCPFPGFPAFDEKMAGVYFGRETETQDVLQQLTQMRSRGEPRFLMIVGGSGSGKSSLLRAGVLPRIERQQAPATWLVLPTLRYGDAPDERHTLLVQLARDLARRFPDRSAAPDWETLSAQLRQEDGAAAAEAFFSATEKLTFALDAADAATILPIDQFEELLAPAAGPSADEFLRFVQAVCAARTGRVLLVTTMRSDYLDVYERNEFVVRPPRLATYRLPPFPRERIRDVIVKPAARTDVKFEPALVERLSRDTESADGLPLLAFTLEKLFVRCSADGTVSLAEYEQLGGMAGTIQSAVARALPANWTGELEVALRQSFVTQLAQVNEKDEVVRRPARWSDLPEKAKPVLENLVEERLLTRSAGDGEDRLEVAHEKLFLYWDELRGWLQTSAEILRWRRDVERDRKLHKAWRRLNPAQLEVARRWPRERGDELTPQETRWIRAGVIRQRSTRGLVAAAIVLISALAIGFWSQKQAADTATDDLGETTAQSLWRPLGYAPDALGLADLELDELGALFDLAALPNERVRFRFLELALADADNAERLSRRSALCVRGAVQLSAACRARVLDELVLPKLTDQASDLKVRRACVAVGGDLESDDPRFREAAFDVLLATARRARSNAAATTRWQRDFAWVASLYDAAGARDAFTKLASWTISDADHEDLALVMPGLEQLRPERLDADTAQALVSRIVERVQGSESPALYLLPVIAVAIAPEESKVFEPVWAPFPDTRQQLLAWMLLADRVPESKLVDLDTQAIPYDTADYVDHYAGPTGVSLSRLHALAARIPWSRLQDEQRAYLSAAAPWNTFIAYFAAGLASNHPEWTDDEAKSLVELLVAFNSRAVDEGSRPHLRPDFEYRQLVQPIFDSLPAEHRRAVADEFALGIVIASPRPRRATDLRARARASARAHKRGADSQLWVDIRMVGSSKPEAAAEALLGLITSAEEFDRSEAARAWREITGNLTAEETAAIDGLVEAHKKRVIEQLSITGKPYVARSFHQLAALPAELTGQECLKLLESSGLYFLRARRANEGTTSNLQTLFARVSTLR